MVGIDIIRDVLASHNFRFESACNWRGLSFAWADYLYPQTGAVLAKYLFIPLTLSEWYDFQTSFEEFLTDVVENIYYSLHNDLCWNLYLVCVLTDEDFSCIDSHARFHFESNTDYVRNLILPMAKLNERLPVGHTLSQFEDRPLIDPEKEWREILGDFDFCLEPCAQTADPREKRATPIL